MQTMLKRCTLIVLLMLSVLWIPPQAAAETLGSEAPGAPYEPSAQQTSSIINLLQNILSAIGGVTETLVSITVGKTSNLSLLESLYAILNKLFVNDSSNPNGQSIMEQKLIALYATNTPQLFAQASPASLASLDTTTNTTDLATLITETTTRVTNALGQELSYDLQRDLQGRLTDNEMLFSSFADNNGTLVLPKEGTPYGGLDSSVSNDFGDRGLDIGAFLEKESYAPDDSTNNSNKAKLFISHLLQTAPPPRNFNIPSAELALKSATPDRSDSNKNKALVSLPYASNNNPYTNVAISVDPDPCNNGDCRSQYQKMLDFLNVTPLYQEYKLKVRAALAQRTVALASIFRVFQERYKSSKNERSLAELEKQMALVGLTKGYYDNLRNKSLAEVNLEVLHTLNKIVYFLHKLHKDSERLQLINTMISLQTQKTLSMQDEYDYIRPISTLIENGCWDTDENVTAPNGLNTGRADICRNPKSLVSKVQI